MSANQNEYVIFMNRRVKLINLISRIRSNLEKLDMVGWVENSSRLRDKVSSDRFRVMILGEFKRGKSTFINALLGEEILPAYATPCTAVINEVKWGMTQRAVLHFRQPLPEISSDSLPEPVLRHIKAFPDKEVPPMEIAIENLEEYVVINDPAKDQSESVAETPYEKVEIFWPLELCKNGVEIIDSPGLNEHGTRTKVTTDYLSKVDAVLFVMSCQALASQSEMQFVDISVRGAGHEDIFFVCNRFDEIRPKEKDRVVSFAQERLSSKTGFGSEGVFFLSSIDALDGRIDKDSELIERSGILRLEQELSRFLINDRGKIKLLQPARELTHAIREAKDAVIPSKLKMLEQTLGELEERYQKVKPQLEDLERRKDQILRKIELERELVQSDLKRLIEAKLRELVIEIPKWVEEIEVKSKISVVEAFTKTSAKAQAKALVKEIVDKLQQRIEIEQNKWKKEKLEPLVNQGMSNISKVIEARVEDFYIELDNIKTDLTGAIRDAKVSAEVTAMQRLIASAGMTYFMDYTNSAGGESRGFIDSLKDLAGIIALMVLAVVLAFVNPITLIPMVLISLFVGSNVIVQQVKKVISKEVVKHIDKDFDKMMGQVLKEISKHTEGIVKYVEIALGKEIQSVKDQVEAVLRDKRAGEAQVQERKLELAKINKELEVIYGEISNFVVSLSDVDLSLKLDA